MDRSCFPKKCPDKTRIGVRFGQESLSALVRNQCPFWSRICKTLTRCIELLKTKGIEINKFRSDAAAYQAKVFDFLDNHPDIEYFVKIQTSKNFYKKISTINDWEEISNYETEIGCKQFYALGKRRRLIVIRKKDKKGEYKYSGIITNNETMTNKKVLFFYNQRGAIG